MSETEPGQQLHEAVVTAARAEGAEGVITDWVVVYATHRYDDKGDILNQVGRITPETGGGLPFHRLLRLLDYEFTRVRAQITEED